MTALSDSTPPLTASTDAGASRTNAVDVMNLFMPVTESPRVSGLNNNNSNNNPAAASGFNAASSSSVRRNAGGKKLSPKELAEQAEFERKRQLELERTAVVASVFASVELATQRATLANYATMCDAAAAENRRLTKEKLDTDRDAEVIVEFLRNEIGKLQAQIKEMRHAFFATLDEERSKHDAVVAKLNEVLQRRDGELAASRAEVERLLADLEALAAFRREKESLQREMYGLRERLQKREAEHEQELSLQRYTNVEEKIRVKALEKSLQERFEAEVESRARALLEPKTRRILSDNAELEADRRRREEEIAKLEQELAEAREGAAGLRRELALSQDAEKELVRKSAARAKQSQALQEQVDGLEARMGTVAESARLTVANAEKETKGALVRLQTERDQAVKAAHALQRDLINVRRLSSAILQQRTDTETFFLDALNMVRAQIAIERANNSNNNKSNAPVAAALTARSSVGHVTSGRRAVGNAKNGGAVMLITNQNAGPLSLSPSPPVVAAAAAVTARTTGGGNSYNSTMNNNNSTADATVAPDLRSVDIGSLSWEDKERVLRALFAKIQAPFLEGPRQQPTPQVAKTILAAAAPAIVGSAQQQQKLLTSQQHGETGAMGVPASVPSSSASSRHVVAVSAAAAATGAVSPPSPTSRMSASGRSDKPPSGRGGARAPMDAPAAAAAVAAAASAMRGGSGSGRLGSGGDRQSGNGGVLFLTENPGFGDIFGNTKMLKAGAAGPPVADDAMMNLGDAPERNGDDDDDDDDCSTSSSNDENAAPSRRTPSDPDGAI